MIDEPFYLRGLNRPSVPLRHSWSDDDPERMFPGSSALAKKLQPLSYRAVLAFALGCAEWIEWKTTHVVSDSPLPRYVEALWAGMVDWSHVLPAREVIEFAWASWRGNARGPVFGAILRLEKIADLTQRKYFASPEASSLAQLTGHVLQAKERAAYRSWSKVTIDRLQQQYPFQKSDPLGDPVPRRILDPGLDVAVGETAAWFAGYLDRLDRRNNPFLRAD